MKRLVCSRLYVPWYQSKVPTWATWEFHCRLRDHCTWHGENQKNSRSRNLLGKLTFPKEQGPSEDNSSSVSQKIPRNFWKRIFISSNFRFMVPYIVV